MEYYQTIQNRAAETAAVINQYLSKLSVGGTTAADLLTQSDALTGLAQDRDDALVASDAAVNAEHLAYLQIQNLVVGLPKAAEAELDESVPAESALLDLLSPAYGINPRTTELALERGMKLKSALQKIDAYLTAQTPSRGPVTSGAKSMADLDALMTAQPALQQAVEDTGADVTAARTALRSAATAVDRWNKRFYAKLQSEARSNDSLAAALPQIITEGANQPRTLGIKSILQGGADNLHLLVSYDAGTYDAKAENLIQWMVAGVDADFTHSATVDPSGNALGAFTVGQTVKIRTRVKTGGVTTGSVRTITIQSPGI